MRKMGVVLASVALAVGLLSFGAFTTTDEIREAQAQTAPAKPNIVFILADDMRKDDLQYMPRTLSVLQDEGMSFQNTFVSLALCCPSRATIMRGQYAHNTNVWSNVSTNSGGLQAYEDLGGEKDNVATRLHDAGYRTALIGKYLNGYADTTTDIPPGWDRWFATQQGYFNYAANDQGSIRHFGSEAGDYQTDVLSRKTNAFISNSASRGKPFFAYVAPKAPHLPARPAPRDLHTQDGVHAPRSASFNEADVSDKPPWIEQLPRLSDAQKAEIDNRHEDRAETLQAVDDLVGETVSTLKNAGVMSNTYIFFTSDNGWHEGEHRIPKGKYRPYEEDIRVPLLVRGPGVRRGSTTYKLTLNTDYLPTFTNLACPSPNSCVTTNWSYAPDGRSLLPVLKESAKTWRNAVLLEAAPDSLPAYYGIRTVNSGSTKKGKYVEYEGPEREFYDLLTDPYELTNTYDANTPPADLVSRVQALKTCVAEACVAAEDGP